MFEKLFKKVKTVAEVSNRPVQHTCGQCGQSWTDETKYLVHNCPGRNYMKPIDPEARR